MKRKIRNLIIKMLVGKKWFEDCELLTLEKYGLQCMIDYFTKFPVKYEGEDRDLERMKLCIRLIDIIIEEPYNFKVNLKNRYRFTAWSDTEHPEYFNDYLYLLKAKNLYYELRKNWTNNWWI